MEYNKNIIGSAETQGGDVINGDNNILIKIVDGLSLLLNDYKKQLDEFNSLILAFKPKTALDLIINLEKRVNENSSKSDNKITSKIYFLKGLCKRELEGFPKEESALDFIKAYNLNNEDEELKIRACIEYLNISEKSKAIDLANNILLLDNYNLTAWFVKSVTSDDIKSFLQSVPKIVHDNYTFQHNIIYFLLGKKNNNLKDYGLKLSFDFNKYVEVTFENRPAWIICLDLLMTTIINRLPKKYVSGENFIIQDDPELVKAIDLLEVYINRLELTEISNTSKHQKFFLNYLKYLSTNDDLYFKSVGQHYNELAKPHWFYTLFYCQLTNHKKEFELSLYNLLEYERVKGELHLEFYLFKFIVLYFLSKDEEIEKLYTKYLNSISIIDYRHLFILIDILDIVQQHTDGNDKFIVQFNKVLEKRFDVDDLKVLLKATIELKCIGYNDKGAILSSLDSIKESNLIDNNCKNLIAENLNKLGKPLDSLNLMDTYIDKTVISESLKLYIFILQSLLQNKEETPKGKAQELLKLLKFWREESNYIEESLLRIEHDLYAKINDLDNLEKVDKLLYCNFPENFSYLYFYLTVLERKSSFNEVKEISLSIPTVYDDERLGIAISGVLLRNKNNVKKGFEILYKLAIDQNNTEARQNYFAGSLLFNDHFENYNSVELGHWVIHIVDGKIEKRKIVKAEGIQKDFLGKKVGDKFINVNVLTNKESIIEIKEIFNDALNLFRDIANEAENPINELGLQSLKIPDDINEFPKFLVEQFGSIGTTEKIRKDNLLNDYYNSRIGFLAIVHTVFKGKFIEAYLNLTNNKDSRFTTIPNIFTAKLQKEEGILKFVLDFSTLVLFYYLEIELKFKFKHKFIISQNTKCQIQNEIILINNSPESTLSVNVTTEGVRNHFYPDDINNQRVVFLQSIINWIDNNCEIDLVAEKLDVVLKLTRKEEIENSIIDNMIDSLHLSIRENHRIVSSDIAVFLFETNKGNNNFLNPEKYLLTYYFENCNYSFYRFLLKSNYLGIDINFETLKNEFSAFKNGKENYYLLVLENLQFSVNNNPDVIILSIEFLEYIYFDNLISITDKNNYAFQLFINIFNGMSVELIRQYQSCLINKSTLFGNYYDHIFNEFTRVKTMSIKS